MIKVVDLECTIARGARPSAIVRARGESGAVGLGEATPLPGRSPDTVDDCARAVAAVRGVLPIALSPSTALAFAADLASAVAATAPAARFAIETALCDLVARTAGWPLARLLAPVPAPAVSINALCASPAEAAAAIARGIACVKIKAFPAVARGASPRPSARAPHGAPGSAEGLDDAPLRDGIAIASAVRRAIGNAALRVDANQAWSAGELDARLHELAAIGVEYVEEPTRGTKLVRAPLAVALALDESLADVDRDAWLDDALASGAFAAVVLKPALIGGLTAALALAARARAHGVDAVVTHSFDGAIATAAACELARAIDAAAATASIGSMTRGASPRAHGLDRPDLPAGAVPQLGPNSARDCGRAGIGIAAAPPRAAALEVSP